MRPAGGPQRKGGSVTGFRVFLVSVSVAVPMRAVAAQQAVGQVVGQVITTDSGSAAVPGAMVSIEGVVVNMQTGPDGSFRFSGVRPGKSRVLVRKLGFAPTEERVSIVAGTETRVVLVLRPRATQLAELSVIGTRGDLDERRDRLAEVPGAVALVESEDIERSRQANLKDALGLVPGVYVQPRFGAADESQISIRGSGLRSNFHARGTNLLVNGMPYRNADGFTDFESLDLLTTEAIEVYKGGNALRYGGSTLGGAINLETKTGYTARPVAIVSEGGSHGLFKGQLSSGMTRGRFDYYASYSRTSIDGFRDWSNQARDRVNAHVGVVLSPSTDLRTFYFYANVNERLPGSLTRGQLYSSPESADPGTRRNTGVASTTCTISGCSSGAASTTGAASRSAPTCSTGTSTTRSSRSSPRSAGTTASTRDTKRRHPSRDDAIASPSAFSRRGSTWRTGNI